MRPVLITGVGRSGTSCVARVIHTRLGVSLGRRFRTPDGANPAGYFEDLDFKELNQAVLNGSLPWNEFFWRLEERIDERQQRQTPWGLKDPRLAHLLGVYRHYLPDARIVRCCRTRDQVVASLKKHYAFSEAQAARFFSLRSALLDRHADALLIDLTRRRSDEELIAELKPYLKPEA